MDEELSLRDSIEQSFDAAPEQDAPVVEVEQEPVADETVEQKAERARDATGKFTKAEVAAEAETPAEVVKKLSPKAWKKEIADKHWDVLDPELQDEILRREEAVSQGFEGYKNHAELGRTVETAILPYMATINKFGATPDQAIKELFNSDHILRYGSEQEKVGMVHRIFKDYGINPQSVFSSMQQQQVDPALQPVYTQLQTMEQKYNQLVSQQQQREQMELTSTLERAKEGKPHFEEVRLHMAALLESGLVPNIDEAYEQAIWARPDLRKDLVQQQVTSEAEKLRNAELARKQQNANSSVRGSTPASGAPASSENLRDVIAQQFN